MSQLPMQSFKSLLILLCFTTMWSCQEAIVVPAINGLPEVSAGRLDSIGMLSMTKKVTFQEKETYQYPEMGLAFSNDFDGARVNGLQKSNDSTFQITISSENSPINPSAWYSFRVDAKKAGDVYVKLNYINASHRYYPKISTDGIQWNRLDENRVLFPDVEPYCFVGQTKDSICLYKEVTLKVPLQKGSTWISGQEVIGSVDNEKWMDRLAKTNKSVSIEVIGQSKQGTPIPKMVIGKGKKAMVIISRQHPPEVTGYLGMRAFVEQILGAGALSESFLKEYQVHVVPMVNPDGANNGHWRHNAGGVDLNRDWYLAEQPEVKALQAHFKKLNMRIDYFIDFHSTWKDIFYCRPWEGDYNKSVTKYWLPKMEERISGFKLTYRESPVGAPINSSAWFTNTFNTDGLTYEIGDETDRDYLKQKGEVAAEEVMKAMLRKDN